MNPKQVPASNVVSVNWWGYLRRTVQAAVALVMLSLAHPMMARRLARPTESRSWANRRPANRRGFARSNGARRTSARLKALGFTVIQVDVAWTRPDDEILNIEDIVELSAEEQKEYPQPVPLRSKAGAENLATRQETIRHRIALAKAAGLRTLLLVGAPYNAHARYGDEPPNCILDEKTAKRHVLMLERLVEVLPGLDDLQVYTYDVDAWLCSEFGKCSRCRGVPLHRRLVGFVNTLAATWRKVNPDGRVWWEPWELSSGQSLTCIELLDPDGLGLVMHCNSAECMATMPVDRWVRNMGAIAKQRGIPVMVQYFLGGTSEETEPYFLSHPLVTLRGLKAIAAVPGLTGIKEYYGLGPDRDDPNLRMTGLFFRNPAIGEDEALNELARPYGDAADEMIRFWRLTSEAWSCSPGKPPGSSAKSAEAELTTASRRPRCVDGHLDADLAIIAALDFHADRAGVSTASVDVRGRAIALRGGGESHGSSLGRGRAASGQPAPGVSETSRGTW